MTSATTNMEREILGAFKTYDDVLSCEQVAQITGYKVTTVRNVLPALAQRKHIWRLSKGLYSLDPHPVEFFAQQDYVLAAFQERSFVSTRYVRQKTGLKPGLVLKIAGELVAKGQLFKIRPGVYSHKPAPAKAPPEPAPPIARPSVEEMVERQLHGKASTSVRYLAISTGYTKREIVPVLESMAERGVVKRYSASMWGPIHPN